VSVATGTVWLLIASVKKAPRYGSGHLSGKLYVDGHDITVFRKADIGFKPSTRRQRRALLGPFDASREVYNEEIMSPELAVPGTFPMWPRLVSRGMKPCEGH
jgi:hypothetical protein